MKRSAKALATGAAIVARPRGLRRLLGALLMLVLVLVLGILVLALVGKSAGRSNEPLPCAPELTTVKFTPDDTPMSVQETVGEALTTAGRSPETTDYGDGERPDLVISWWPTREPLPPILQGRTLRLEAEPTVEEVVDALDTKLASCDGDGSAADDTSAPQQSAPEDTGRTLTWSSPVAWIGAAVILWWLAGPGIARAAFRGIYLVQRRKAPGGDSQPGGAPKTKGVSR